MSSAGLLEGWLWGTWPNRQCQRLELALGASLGKSISILKLWLDGPFKRQSAPV
jgi:hypothetical protein